MATLKVYRLDCKEETDEIGADDIYLLVFIGKKNPNGGSRVLRIGPGDYWPNLDTGEVRGQEVTVTNHYSPNKLYLVAMMEKDGALDFNEQQRKQLEISMKSAWQVWGINPMGIPSELVVINLAMAFSSAISEHGNGDDICGVKLLTPAHVNSLNPLEFKEEGGHYALWFKAA